MTLPTPLVPLEFPLYGNRLIEASAGTGKTWTIAALYVRLVLGHGRDETRFHRPLLPTEILVVTFTEAATLELRDRIRSRLTEAARCFRGYGKPDAFLQELIADYSPDQHPACAHRLELAAQWMDDAAIYTIHGWCSRMLRQHAFDSGALFDLKIETHDAELLAEVVRDYWRTFFYPLDEVTSLAVAEIANSPDQLHESLSPLLKESLAEWELGGDGAIQSETLESLLQHMGAWERRRQNLEQDARECWSQHRETLEAMLREASNNGWLNGNSYPPRTFESRLRSLADWAENGIPCKPEWLAGFAQDRFKLKANHQDKCPRHAAFEKLGALVNHLDAKPDIRNEVLIHAAQWVRDRFAVEKQRRAQVNFDDLLTHLDTALQSPGGTRLAEVIRAQFPVALIDEFQDTDPVQYRIFETVYRIGEDNRELGLFMIGDPKQAIYSFRGADIHAYLKARVATKGRHYTLGRNFRSTRELVDGVNRIFQYADSHQGGAFKFETADGENPIPFLAVEAQGRNEALVIEDRPAPVLAIWHQPGDSAGDALSLTDYRKTMAEVAASEIVRLLNLAGIGQAGFRSGDSWTPLKPADIAILVRDRTDAAAIRSALGARGLRSVYLSDQDSVFATREAKDLLFWLKACAEPERDRHLRAALATATLDLGYDDLERLRTDELRWEGEVERFRGYRTLWRYQGVLPMLRRLLADFDVPARLLRTSGGERTLTNLLHLAELLQPASTGMDGEYALIRYLEEAIEEGDDGGENHILRLESDADLIKVITIHKSKGLEYPLVFLPFVCAFREVDGNGKATYYRYHAEDGMLRIALEKSEAAKQRADLERLQEDLRLLYVALTRARHACWLGVAPIKVGKGKTCHLHKSALGHVLAGTASLSPDELGERLKALKGDCATIQISEAPAATDDVFRIDEAAPSLVPAREYTGRIPERWWIASYSALRLQALGTDETATGSAWLEAPETAVQAALVESASEDSGMARVESVASAGLHDFPQGAQSGVFLHGLLEWAARQGFARVVQDDGLREDVIARRCQKRGWVHWIRPLDQWLVALLNTPLALPQGQVALSRLEAGRYQPELEFWFASGEVDTTALDGLVTRHTLDGAPRSSLCPDRLNGLFKGFIDLVFEHEGRYYVLDYKSNRFGSDGAAYTLETMRKAVLENRYDLQYTLYLLALHRQLKARLGPAYDYDRHVGGAAYLFLRGIDGPEGGVYRDKPPRHLIETLDELFSDRPEVRHAA